MISAVFRTCKLLCFLVVVLCSAAAPALSNGEEREGGILGTGLSRTGIIGTITGFGSIHVNGLRVLTPDGLEVEDFDGTAPITSLNTQDTVLIEATQSMDNILEARRIQRYLPLIGPIESFSKDGQSARIMGVEFALPSSQPRRLTVGQWVTVSGLWKGHGLIVTQLRTIPPQKQVQVLGAYSAIAGTTNFMIGGVEVEGLAVQHAAFGDLLRVRGTYESGKLQAQNVKARFFSQDTTRFVVEGFLSDTTPQGRYSVNGTGLFAYTEDPEQRMPKDRAIFCGETGTDPSITRETLLTGPRSSQVSKLEQQVSSAIPVCQAP